MGAVSQSGSAQVYDATSDEERGSAVDAAALAIQRGRLVVLPTDTVYGLAADAFDAEAVARLLDAKGRGREMPPPVLVSTATTLDALATKVPDYARALTNAFWPGPLTLVCHEQASLRWDLGDTRGTVAVRMPDHDLTREILDRTGPLAVSSANLTGSPAATDAAEAVAMLGDRVAVVIDGGTSAGAVPSTIIDATGDRPRLLRLGAITVEQLDEALEETGLTVETADDTAEDAE
jgi:L-threonylcarbamoyladenylate synthase